MTVLSTPSAAPFSVDPLDARGTFEVLVRGARLEADQVMSLELARPDGGELPAWAPGAHIDLVLPSGRVRQYSLCGDPAQRGAYRIAILREPAGRGGSAEIHDTALIGRVLSCRPPRNHFELVEAREYVFVAGGIGITPILPMISAVTDTAFTVVLRRSGTELLVPVGRSLLDVVREAVPTILSDCEEGYCGTCETAGRRRRARAPGYGAERRGEGRQPGHDDLRRPRADPTLVLDL